MKILHLSDLHIGKRVNEFSMLDDQKYILQEILKIIKIEKPDCVLIAGDIYDKTVPSGEAVEVFDDFLTELCLFKKPIGIISGNHDSPERLNFGSRIMEKNNIYISGTFNGKLNHFKCCDEYGFVNFYLLPFVKPTVVSRYFPDVEINSYNGAVKTILESTPIITDERNILVAHQFITSGLLSPERSDSEIVSLGGIDNIDVSLFSQFDYVALGHLHGPQSIGRHSIRYCGSPLKYSFSESRQKKSVTLVNLNEKNNLEINQIPLVPLHDMRAIKGPISQLTNPIVYSVENTEDYIHATLTDEQNILDPMGKLRTIYPNIMRLEFENNTSNSLSQSKTAAIGDIMLKTPLELFEEFYENRQTIPMSENQLKIMKKIFEKAGGNEN